MADIAELGYKVDSSDLEKASKALDKNTTAAGKTGAATKKLERDYQAAIKQAKLFGAAVGTIGLALGGLIIKNTIDAAREQAQLAAVLKSTGGVAGQTQVGLNAMADALQQVSTFAAGNVTEMQAVLLTFTKIQGDVFPKAQTAILDMATALGMDLQGAAIQVGKALNDPILGVSALGRAGVQFSEQQKEVIKVLVETGRTAEAQTIILAELETQFGGSAKAASETLGGALTVLKNNFNDLLEGDSGGDGVRGATEAIRELSAIMAAPETKEAFGTVINGLASVTAEIVKGLAYWTNYIAKISEMNGLATNKGLLDSASYDKINDRLEQVQSRLTGLQQTNKLMAATPGNWLLEAAGEDAGAEAARMEKGGFNPYSRSGEIEFLLAERERLIREGTERIRADIATASGTAAGDDRVFDGGMTVINAGEEFGKGKRKSGRSAADKAEAEAARAQAEADRAAAEALRDRTDAQADFLGITEDLRAELGGPFAEVQLEYTRREDELIALGKLAGLTNEELAESLGLLEAARLRDVDAITAQAEAEAARAKAIADQPLIDQMDSLRDTTAGFFVDLVRNGEDAIDRLQDYLLNSALESIGKQIAEGLFGTTGSTGGGLLGNLFGGGSAGDGGLGGFFSSLFGGGRALGGDVRGDRMYQVGERDRPELADIGGKQFLIPGDRGRVEPIGAGAGGSRSSRGTTVNNITFVLPGRNDIRTDAQRQADMGRATAKQLDRSTA